MTTTPFRWLAREVDERAGGKALELLSVSASRGVIPRSQISEAGGRADDLSNYKVCRPDDIVVNRMSAYQGALGRATQSGIVSPDYAVLRTAVGVDSRYLTLVMRSAWFVSEMTSRLRGIGAPGATSVRTPRVNVETLGDIAVPSPPLDQQRRLADFLDDQVARIDQIVASRRLQIAAVNDLVDAHAHAVFSQRSIADAPALRLGASCSFFDDGDWIESPFITDHGVRLIQTGNVGVGTYREQGFRYISDETFVTLHCTPVYEGDILISRLASPVGRACLCPRLGPAIASVDVTIARPEPWMDAQFVVEFLSSPKHLNDTDELARGSTIQRVSRSQLSSVRVPRPDLVTQQKVGSELAAARRTASSRADALENSVRLLEEYKRSVITAAVTGELDVTTAGNGIPG